MPLIITPDLQLPSIEGPLGGGGDFILDKTPMMVAYDPAFQLKGNQTKIMLVREDGGGLEAWIAPDGGALDEAELLAHTGLNNGFIKTLKDAQNTASTYDATQTTALLQPQIVASGVVVKENEKPAADYFSGATLYATVPLTSSPLSFFLIANIVENVAEQVVLGDTEGDVSIGFYDTGIIFESLFWTGTHEGVQNLYAFTGIEPNNTLRINGVEQETAVGSFTNFGTTMSIGSLAGIGPSTGKYQTVLLLNTGQSADFPVIENWLAAKYGIPLSYEYAPATISTTQTVIEYEEPSFDNTP